MKKIKNTSDIEKIKECIFCKNLFNTIYSYKKYCSEKCCKKHYFKLNKEKIYNQQYEWIKNNPEKHRLYQRKSDAKRRNPRFGLSKECETCKNLFVDNTFNHCKKFCSISCRNKSHKEYQKMVLKDWRHKNYDKFKAQWTRANNKNKERFKIHRRKLIEKLGGSCFICGFNLKLNIHHKLPKSKGGSNKLENLILLCPNHHLMLHAGLLSQDLTKKLITNK